MARRVPVNTDGDGSHLFAPNVISPKQMTLHGQTKEKHRQGGDHGPAPEYGAPIHQPSCKPRRRFETRAVRSPLPVRSIRWATTMRSASLTTLEKQTAGPGGVHASIGSTARQPQAPLAALALPLAATASLPATSKPPNTRPNKTP